jgi:phosphonate transport system substrate-binding protein
MKRTAFLRIGLAGACVLAACSPRTETTAPAATPSAGPPKTLRFSAIPNQNSTELKAKFDPMAAYLSGVLGVPVEFVPSSDYKASVDMFKNGQIQLAWFGGVTGVQARAAVPGARAIVQGREDTVFQSFFIAHKDSGLEPSETFPTALGGLKFAFGAETSTSGRVMPSWFIKEQTGRSEAEFFVEKPIFSGSHDKTCELVEAGQVQAGVVDYMVYNKRVAAGTTRADVCRVVWSSPTFPDYNFTVHPSLDTDFGAGFTDKLQAALIGMTTEKPDLLKAFPREALIEAKNSDYVAVEDVCRALGLVR